MNSSHFRRICKHFHKLQTLVNAENYWIVRRDKKGHSCTMHNMPIPQGQNFCTVGSTQSSVNCSSCFTHAILVDISSDNNLQSNHLSDTDTHTHSINTHTHTAYTQQTGLMNMTCIHIELIPTLQIDTQPTDYWLRDWHNRKHSEIYT